VGDIVIENRYEREPPIVWAALTDPALVPLWTSTGQGGRPEDFSPVVGTRFRFVGKPAPGWDGIVRCEVLAADQPRLLRYSWRNKENDSPTEVSYELQPDDGGTLFTYRHTGFRGVEGMIMSRLLGRVRRKMLATGLPRVLADMDEDGQLRPSSTLTRGP
jgi:uncharacterized protein YndB with AHSA1/START domain